MVSTTSESLIMKEIALHLIDLAENSVSANAKTIHISVTEDFRTDQLMVSGEDDGRGMGQETVERLSDPFYTSRTTRNVGLGIPLLKEQAETCNGRMNISSRPGAGTKVEAFFQHSHIDRMPLGNLPSTFLTLEVAHPEIHWVFTYTYLPPFKGSPRVYEFDDQPVKETLDGLSLTHPDVIAFLRSSLEEGIAEARS
jgi:anti-sigma regulatory factor (Ser/Thr protein kinase)